jgi:type III restriction enzyme
MLEPKASNQTTDAEVLAKRDAAVRRQQATDHTRGHGGKPWAYVLILHNVIAEDMTLDGLMRQYSVA